MDFKISRDSFLPDFIVQNSDFATEDSLIEPVLISIHTDARATSDELQAADMSDDQRGWWGDDLSKNTTGSKLWLLSRAKKTNETLARGEEYVRNALAWFITDDLVRAVEVRTAWRENISDGVMDIFIKLFKPTGELVQLKTFWKGIT